LPRESIERKKLRESDDPLVIVFYFPLVATPAAVPFMIGRAVWPTPFEWLLLVGVGVVTQVGQIFLTKGLHREKAGRAMSMSYVQVVFAASWGFLFFRETPNSLTILGAALILGGMLVVSRTPFEAVSMAFAWPVQTGKKMFPKMSSRKGRAGRAAPKTPSVPGGDGGR
jgi:drug/metabolite transporter (DMT)-like permease